MTGSGWKLQLLTNISIYRFSNPKNRFSRKFKTDQETRKISRNKENTKEKSTRKINKSRNNEKNQESTKKSNMVKTVKTKNQKMIFFINDEVGQMKMHQPPFPAI